MHSKWMMGQWMQSEGANRSEQRFAPALDNRVPPICAKIYHIRQIGLRKEVAQIPFLIAILREAAAKKAPDTISPGRGMPWHADYSTHLYAVTIVALGRLGAQKAIPVLETLSNRLEYLQLKPFVEVALARIKAEKAVPIPKTSREWWLKVRCFLAELDMSFRDLARLSHRLPDEDDPSRRPPKQERLALRALAEMAADAYKNGYRDSFRWLNQSGIVWDSDIAAWLSVELATRSPAQQLAWLLDQFRAKSTIRFQDAYLSQALSDLGEMAVSPLEQWLDDLWRERASEVRQSSYTRTDRLLIQCFALLSATCTAKGRAILIQQYNRCRSDDYLRSNLALILDQSPWTFVSDW
jgi:hypothetical protein